MSTGRAVLWSDGCFAVVSEDGNHWVVETLHSAQFGDKPHRWNIPYATPEDARRLIASRLREGHDHLYHVDKRVRLTG